MKLQDIITKIQEIELTKTEEGIIKLYTADPDIPPDNRIIKRIKEYVDQFHYCDTRGTQNLRELIAIKYGVGIKNVLIGCGSRHLLFGLIIINPKKRIIVPDPEWAYDLPINLSNIVRVKWSSDETGQQFVKKLINKVNQSVDYVLISNPNNPTSRILSYKSIKKILKEGCNKRNNCFLIEDRAYESLAFCKMQNCILSKKHIIIGSFSKAFSMPGYRLGYIISKDLDLIAKMKDYIYNSIQCLPICIQKGACQAIKYEKEIVKKVKLVYKERLIIAEKILQESNIEYIKPKAYPFLYIKVDNCEIVSEQLLKQGVAVAPSTAFSQNNDFIRVTLVEDIEKIKIAMYKIVKVIKRRL
ncbi:MAG: aminotransferase class I/II-fold pyridoxal phosphate-dependent enzyme [Xanthomonadaceae bacterium]|nr:aminotransferase class I/II-fold pyridoxal phosphate-dependent enzyme [Rhodospirillaceae bacterium]NIA17734.1 aminotransferase class I/II-fold pyridoxal phosphate-dependent enzyme [Xanthomonadaceae bacterium]